MVSPQEFSSKYVNLKCTSGDICVSSEECVLAIQNILNEVRNVCPQVLSVFIFKPDRTVVAKDRDADEAAIGSTVDALSLLVKYSKIGGGLDSFTVNGADYRATVKRINNFYFVAVASGMVNEKILDGLTQGVVLTVLKLVELIQPELGFIPTEFLEDFKVETAQVDSEEREVEQAAAGSATAEVTADSDSLLDSVVSHMIVENTNGIGRLLGSQDTVRVDPLVIDRWLALCGEREIAQVEVQETQTGKKILCKLKPIKDAAFDGTGIIMLPEKIQSVLQAMRGTLVLVKPIIKK